MVHVYNIPQQDVNHYQAPSLLNPMIIKVWVIHVYLYMYYTILGHVILHINDTAVLPKGTDYTLKLNAHIVQNPHHMSDWETRMNTLL